MVEAKKKSKRTDSQFEFCEVCKLNHNLGRRHNYLPNHVKSLSSFLSRIQSKLADVRFFLRNPTILRPEHASRNRIWCVFCDADVDEVGSSFACGNAINHLASADHLKNVKAFMWKYGGGMDQVDSFRISEADLTKFEKKCISLTSEHSGERSHGALIGPSNDIHNELNFELINNYDKTNVSLFSSSFSNGVLPLQNHTNESYQVPQSELDKVATNGTSRTQLGTYTLCSNHVASYVRSQTSSSAGGRHFSAAYYHCNGLAHADEDIAIGKSCLAGFPKLPQISSKAPAEDAGNVHSGAPPPWLSAMDGDHIDGRLQGVGTTGTRSSVKSRITSKLNPKRVGAAWAERRKIELELEKRGELVANNFDASWLPDFGRVWQSGSRKESRREFQMEDRNAPNGGSQCEVPLQLQPYVRKRMRRDANE